MRRSRSSSSIPLPLSSQNKRDSRSKERNIPVIRNSREPSLDAQTPLNRQRLVIPDRLYSTQQSQLRTPTTPSTYSGLKRSNSLSSFGSRVSVTKNKSPGTKKTIQKLISDKKWLSDQYAKIQDFILHSGLINPELISKLRPPTIAIFVELVRVLFKQIIKTAPINLQNYGEIVINTLKLLRYPGQITPSIVKTVNTMHGWPHFIAIVSWLIERVNLSGIVDDFKQQQEDDVKQTFEMHDAVSEFLSSQYISATYDSTSEQSLLLKSEDELYTRLLTITGTDRDVALKMHEQLERERSEFESIHAELQAIEEENEKIKAQNLYRQNVIDKYEESKGNRELELREEIEHLQKAVGEHRETKAASLESIKQLENVILTQTCKYTEKMDILNQIDDLKRIIERKKAKLAQYGLVRDEMDYEMRALVVKVGSLVDDWNISIMKTFLPELEDLRLREKQFYSHSFLEEIADTRKKVLEIQEGLLKEWNLSKSAIEKLIKQRESVVGSNKMIDLTRKRISDLRSSIQAIEEENKKLLSDIEDCKKTHEAKLNEIAELEENRIKEQNFQINEYKERKQKLTLEMESTAQKLVLVIFEAHKMCVGNIQAIEEKMCSMVNDMKVTLTERMQNENAAFNHLKRLEEIRAKLYNVMEEED